MRKLLKSFKALSDETRLRILNILLERECCVCEVMQALQISQTRASRNINALYEAGFLELKREGVWALYSINTDSLNKYYMELIGTVREALKENKMALEDLERLRSAQRIGPRYIFSSVPSNI